MKSCWARNLAPVWSGAISGLAAWVALVGCVDSSSPGIDPVFDTLPNGVIQVENPPTGLWQAGEGFVLHETLRIGTVHGDGPDLFGWIQDLEVDAAGGIDSEGFFYDLEKSSSPGREEVLVRYDGQFHAVDTIPVPEHPEGSAGIQVPTPRGVATYPKPFAGRAEWALVSDGGMWVAITDQYKLLRLTREGDTLRVVTKPFVPVSVTAEERDERLKGLREVGADLSRFEVPSSKPPIADIFVDDQENAWVIPVLAGDETESIAEVFDSLGVFLGEVQLPLRLPASPVIIRDQTLTTITIDSLGVPYVVRFKIQDRSAG